MSDSIARKIQQEQGWTDATLLDLCLTYIDNQQSDAAFQDFLEEASVDEEDFSPEGEPPEYIMADHYADLTQPGIYDREPAEPGMDCGPDMDDY